MAPVARCMTEAGHVLRSSIFCIFSLCPLCLCGEKTWFQALDGVTAKTPEARTMRWSPTLR
jgi:hypothetical protein